MKQRALSRPAAAAAISAVAWTWFDCAANVEGLSFPWDAWIDRVEVQLTGINPGGAPTVSCRLSYTAAGTVGCSRIDVQTPINDPAANTRGTSIHPVAGYYPSTSDAVPGRLYVGLLLSAGVAVALPRVIWSKEDD